jgi:hypothetical protein
VAAPASAVVVEGAGAAVIQAVRVGAGVARLTTFLGDDDARVRRTKLLVFETILVLVVCTEQWCHTLVGVRGTAPTTGQLALVTTVCGLATFHPRLRRSGFVGLVLVHLLVAWRFFPATGNHRYLELILCTLAVLVDPRAEADRVPYLASLRWLVVLVLFYSGVQKLVHGYYFRGLYLAYAMVEAHFRPIVSWMMPAAEAARLSALQPAVGSGPYLTGAPLLLLASNAVYATEIGLAGLLLLPRARPWAVPLVFVFLVAVESAAREVFFGTLFVSGALLFRHGATNRTLVPAVVLLMTALLLARVGVLPPVAFY